MVNASPKTFVFVHHVLPGQFPHIARALAEAGHKVVFITKATQNQLKGVTKVSYTLGGEPIKGQHKYLTHLEAGINNARMVATTLEGLKKDHGIHPDIVIGHSGWGEMMFVKDVLPKVPVLSYFEFFYRRVGADLDFDKEYPPHSDAAFGLHGLNAVNLISLNSCDRGFTPTQWQWQGYPAPYRPKLEVLHEGVDTQIMRRRPDARLVLPDGGVLTANDEVVTYVARNLEPYRGFHVFMRAIPEILARRPKARIVLIGGEGVSYGIKLPQGQSYKQKMLAEIEVDPARVHFLGNVPYDVYRDALHVSSAHVYLTYPFILSWSLLEAMAAECTIIGSRTAPVEEAIEHGRTGLLVDFFDHKALAAQIADVLANKGAYAPLGPAARCHVLENYDLQTKALPHMKALLTYMIARGA